MGMRGTAQLGGEDIVAVREVKRYWRLRGVESGRMGGQRTLGR